MRCVLLLALLAPACTDEPDPLATEDRTCSREWQGTAYIGPEGPLQTLIGDCLDAAIDLDVAAAGYQTDCVVTLYRDVGLDERELDVVQQLRACDDAAPNEPCLGPFAAATDECPEATQYDIRLNGYRSAFPLWAEFRCRLACEPT